MKQSCRLALSVVIAVLMTSSALAQMSEREFNRIDHGKITKAEAQHLVLQKFPGAKIKKCELKGGKDHSYFAVDLVKSGTRETTKVRVDGRSGKILQ